jgi:hypothetical protein
LEPALEELTPPHSRGRMRRRRRRRIARVWKEDEEHAGSPR